MKRLMIVAAVAICLCAANPADARKKVKKRDTIGSLEGQSVEVRPGNVIVNSSDLARDNYRAFLDLVSDDPVLRAEAMLVTLALSLVWPFLPSPEPDPNEIVEVPERIARLMLEEKPLPPPPPPPEPEPEPEPEVEEPDPIEPEPERVVEETPPPEPEPEPVPDQLEVAREQAQAALMPFAEDLADLVDQDLVESVADDRPLTGSVGEAARNERSMITSQVGTASAGINTANMAVDTVDPCGVYFGTTGGQVYASSDSGDHWTPIVRDLPAVLSVEVQTIP